MTEIGYTIPCLCGDEMEFIGTDKENINHFVHRDNNIKNPNSEHYHRRAIFYDIRRGYH